MATKKLMTLTKCAAEAYNRERRLWQGEVDLARDCFILIRRPDIPLFGDFDQQVKIVRENIEHQRFSRGVPKEVIEDFLHERAMQAAVVALLKGIAEYDYGREEEEVPEQEDDYF